MKKIIFGYIIFSVLAVSCNTNSNKKTEKNDTVKKENCEDSCCKTPVSKADKCCEKEGEKSNISSIECKLTSLELKKSRAKSIEGLRKQILEKKELPDGYSFKFSSNDNVIDDLVAFIKSERKCCSFFTFKLFTKGNQNDIWLDLTGPDGTKDFINENLEFY